MRIKSKFKKINYILFLFTILTLFVSCKINRKEVFNDLNNYVYVHYIDVGQGDSILIKSKGCTVLIDAGERDKKDIVVNYLKSVKVKDIDYIIATHPHSDHIGGISAVLDKFNVKHIMMPDVISNSITFEKLLNSIERKKLKIEEPIPGKKLNIGNIEFHILAPNSKKYEKINDYSIVLKMIYGKSKFLFTGDAEKTSEKEMLKYNYDLYSQVYKVGHHGSNTSSTLEFLKKIQPKIAIISCGSNNKYGHPHAEVLDRLNKIGAKIYRTDEMGTVVIKTDGENIITER